VEPNGYAIFTPQFTPRLPFDLRHNGARVRVLGSSGRRGATFLYEIKTQDGSTAWVAPWELQPLGHSLGYSGLDKEAKV
jgi:hypothetical protein